MQNFILGFQVAPIARPNAVVMQTEEHLGAFTLRWVPDLVTFRIYASLSRKSGSSSPHNTRRSCCILFANDWIRR